LTTPIGPPRPPSPPAPKGRYRRDARPPKGGPVRGRDDPVRRLATRRPAPGPSNRVFRKGPDSGPARPHVGRSRSATVLSCTVVVESATHPHAAESTGGRDPTGRSSARPGARGHRTGAGTPPGDRPPRAHATRVCDSCVTDHRIVK